MITIQVTEEQLKALYSGYSCLKCYAEELAMRVTDPVLVQAAADRAAQAELLLSLAGAIVRQQTEQAVGL